MAPPSASISIDAAPSVIAASESIPTTPDAFISNAAEARFNAAADVTSTLEPERRNPSVDDP